MPFSRLCCSFLLLPIALLVSCSSKTKPITLDLKAGCNPLATTSECLYPIPSSFFQSPDKSSPTGVRVSYPAGSLGGTSALQTTIVDVTPYNTADGASTVSPLLMYFGANVDLSNLPDQHHIPDSVAAGAPIALIDLETGARVPYFVEMDANVKPNYPNRYAFIIRPVAPMEMGHLHAVIITDAVTLEGGTALTVTKPFAALRDGTITTNAVIEQQRPAYERLFTVAGSQGYERQHIALAWTFMVASDQYLLSPIESLRTQALKEVGSHGEGYANGTFGYTITAIKSTDTGGELVEGTFDVPNWVNANNQFDWDSNHLPIEHPGVAPPPEYTMYIPTASLQSGAPPLPLGIFGHGLLGTGRGYLDGTEQTPEAIRSMAERVGAVLIATDWTGLSGTQDDTIVAGTVADNINDLGMVTDRLTQSLINAFVMSKFARGILQDDPQVTAVTQHTALLDPDRTLYYGVSLGGIQGASLVSISDEITRGILAVPGAAWATMFPRSVDWLQFYTIANPTYPDPLQQITLVSLMQSRFDFSDGANLTKLMYKEPLAGAPAKTVLLQESIDDCQVQNVVTELLARAIGVQQLTPQYGTIFPLSPIADVTTQSAIAQYYLTSDIAKYVPPDTDVPAAMDNGAHFDMNLEPQSQQQIITFLQTGFIEQTCGGVCILE